MELLENNWEEIKKRVILPLWNGKFKKMYENAKMDYNDFESLVGMELSKSIANFDSNKSNLLTFVTGIINRKALTELRNCTQRDKRKTLYVSESIDQPIDADSSRTIGDNIPCQEEQEDNSELSELRVGHFINSLNNNQLRVLILSLLDFDSSDFPNMLNISNSTASSIIRSLKDTDLTRILYRRKF